MKQQLTEIPEEMLDLVKFLANACVRFEEHSDSLTLDNMTHRQVIAQRIRKVSGKPFDFGKIEAAINYLLSH